VELFWGNDDDDDGKKVVGRELGKWETVGNILFSWGCDAITKAQFQQLTSSI